MPAPCRAFFRKLSGAAQASDRVERCADRRKRQCEQGAPSGIVRDSHLSTMRLHDFLDDCESQAGTCRSWPLAAPKAIENAFAVVQWHAASAVRDAHARIGLNCDRDFSAWGRVQNGILNEISDCVRYRDAVPLDPGWRLGADEGDGTF